MIFEAKPKSRIRELENQLMVSAKSTEGMANGPAGFIEEEDINVLGKIEKIPKEKKKTMDP